jgi:hypothetical protein
MARTIKQRELGIQLGAFLAAHGHQVTNALQNQERHMREAAEETTRAAWAPQGPPPEATTGYINLTPTPAGYAGLAETFTQAADTAAAALAAWEALEEQAEQEDDAAW